ncbi:hypothetical protein BGZ74_000297 [Mortierella antarctica]|nr:hypothetical protein BGZ74_000297 [Mortierella antarctica]
MLKRPRIVLLSSLCFWTLLMVLSSMGGLNTIRPMVSSPTQNNDSLQIQPVPPSPSEFSAAPYGDDLLLWEPSSIVVEVDPLPVVYPEGFTMAEDVEDDAEVVPEPFEMVVVRPELVVVGSSTLDVGSSTLEEFLEVTNSIEPMAAASENEEKRSALASSPPPSPAWVKRDFEDEQEETPVDDMEAMTLDPEDATVFRDFLLSLEAEEQARHVFEDNSEERRKVLQATEDLIVDSIFENEIPCRNTGRTGLLAPFTSTESSLVFEYRAGWTDLMIVAIAMSLGGVLVGLAQARVLAKELQQQQLANSCRPGYLSIFSCMLLSSSALGLTMLMIFGECWDTPSVYFTGIGVAGIILVQAWVPDQAIGSESCLPLVTPDSDDFVNVSCLNNGDDAGEDAFVDEKFQVQVVSNSELLTVAERRNACSLDESRRWEVTSCCRSDSC